MSLYVCVSVCVSVCLCVSLCVCVCVFSVISDSFNPIDYSPASSSVHAVLQARILEWAAISFSRDLPDPGTEPTSLLSPALAGGFFTTSATWEARTYLLASRCFLGEGDGDPLQYSCMENPMDRGAW